MIVQWTVEAATDQIRPLVHLDQHCLHCLLCPFRVPVAGLYQLWLQMPWTGLSPSILSKDEPWWTSIILDHFTQIYILDHQLTTGVGRKALCACLEASSLYCVFLFLVVKKNQSLKLSIRKPWHMFHPGWLPRCHLREKELKHMVWAHYKFPFAECRGNWVGGRGWENASGLSLGNNKDYNQGASASLTPAASQCWNNANKLAGTNTHTDMCSVRPCWPLT